MYRLEVWEYVKLIVVTEVSHVGDYLQTSGVGCLCTVFRRDCGGVGGRQWTEVMFKDCMHRCLSDPLLYQGQKGATRECAAVESEVIEMGFLTEPHSVFFFKLRKARFGVFIFMFLNSKTGSHLTSPKIKT